MPSSWQTVRVFISSTFRDMHAERDHLVKVVFPALRERLEKYRIYLIDIDLRWGVTREQAENDQVLALCLHEIDVCRPFFIGILGERYGWVLTRYSADALKHFGWIQQHTGKSLTELEIIHGVLQNPQMRGHAFFYFRDANALQAVPEAVRREVYAETDPERQAKLVDLKRRIRYSGYPVMENYPARWDWETRDRPSKSKGRLVGLEEFGKCVQEQLWAAIREQSKLPDIPPSEMPADPLAEELDFHNRFMESRLRVYVGREQIHRDLLAFAEGNEPVPCLVTGPSGSGKSAALARFVTEYRPSNPDTLVIPNFVGASPRSTNLQEMLRRFCQDLYSNILEEQKRARLAAVEGDSDEAKDKRKAIEEEYGIPDDTVKLVKRFGEFLGKVPAHRRVLLVIDALNQLDEKDRAQELEWLPAPVPPHVKIIVSCIADSGKQELVLEAFECRPCHRLHVVPLGLRDRLRIIRHVPALSAKTLDRKQRRVLLKNPATANPLFLLVALEELRGFGSYDQLNERIAALPRSGDTVTALFTQVIMRLEEEFDREVVQAVLLLLASSRHGLAERELQALVSGQPGKEDLFPVLGQLRPYLLRRAGLIDFYHQNLSRAVRERYLETEEKQRTAHARLAGFFRGQESFLESPQEQRQRARRLPPTPRPANVHKVDELPWQLLHAGHLQQSVLLLTDLAFLEAKTEAGSVFDLADDFAALAKCLPAEEPMRRHLQLVEEAIRRDVHFLAGHPTTLFQCLWNSCRWYDSPEAEGHYEPVHVEPIDGQICTGSPAPAGPRLCSLLESWREQKARAFPDFAWIRSLRPPSPPLGGSAQLVLRGHQGQPTCLAVSPDGKRVASGSCYFGDRSVRVWDVKTGKTLLLLGGPKDSVHSLAWSPDGGWLVGGLVEGGFDGRLHVWDAHRDVPGRALAGEAGINSRLNTSAVFAPDGRTLAYVGRDQTVRIIDFASGRELQCLAEHDGMVESIAFSPDGSRLVSGCSQKTVRVWNVAEGACVLGLEHPQTGVNAVAWSSKDRHIITGSKDGAVRVWDAGDGRCLHTLIGHKGSVECLAVSPDGRGLASGSIDHSVRVWAIETGEPLNCMLTNENRVTALAYLPDGRLVSACSDGALRILDPEAKAQRNVQGHSDHVMAVACSPDGRWMASSSKDHTVRLWDAKRGVTVCVCHGHRFWVKDVVFSPDSKRLASGSYDGTARIWDVANGSELLCLHVDRAMNPVFVRWTDEALMTVVSGTFQFWDPITGCLLSEDKRSEEFEGGSMFRYPPPDSNHEYPLQILRDRWQTAVQDVETDGIIACMPNPMPQVFAHPSGRTWIGCGVDANDVYLFTLEGASRFAPYRKLAVAGRGSALSHKPSGREVSSPPRAAAPPPVAAQPSHREVLEQVRTLLQADPERGPDAAAPASGLRLLEGCGHSDPLIENARAVCLLQQGRAEQAVTILRTLVLRQGLFLRTDVPLGLKTNYALALLGTDNLDGTLTALAELAAQGEASPALEQLNHHVRGLRNSRKWSTRLLRWLTNFPIKPCGPLPSGEIVVEEPQP